MTDYSVKVADSCPLAIEQQRNTKKPDIDNEQLHQQRIKKQIFMDKISRELKEKEKQKALAKKQATADALANGNIEEFLKVDEVDEHTMKKKAGARAIKKIYPVSITFHQKTKLLAVCLIDCDIKVYRVKSSGTNVQVTEYHSF